MSSSRNSTLMAEFSCHKKNKKSLRNPLIRVSPSPFSKRKTIGFAILCSSHKRGRAVLGHREHFRLKYFNMTLLRATPRRGKCCWQELNANEAAPQHCVCLFVCVSGLSGSLRELSLILPSREGRGKRGGGARGREKHRVIKGQREPWWSSRASRCFEIKASFEDVKIWYSLCWIHWQSIKNGRTTQRGNVNAFCIEGFVSWFHFFTINLIVICFFSNKPSSFTSLVCSPFFSLFPY